jgi:hypothetical protein
MGVFENETNRQRYSRMRECIGSMRRSATESGLRIFSVVRPARTKGLAWRCVSVFAVAEISDFETVSGVARKADPQDAAAGDPHGYGIG